MIPILIVIGLFVATVVIENKVDARRRRTQVDVTCTPSSGAGSSSTRNGVKVIGQTTDAPTMVVPDRRDGPDLPALLDVMHGFYVPEFNFSRYASPGYSTHFDFNVLHNGVYRGQCTQLCGLYHSLMFFNVRSVSPAAYQSWLRTTAASSGPPVVHRPAPERPARQYQRDRRLGQLRQLGQLRTAGRHSATQEVPLR